MAYYESVFIARPDITPVQVEGLSESFKTIVSENGGKAINDEYWGLRSLAYRIKKNRKGHFVLINLDAPAAAVRELERNMRINEDILRFITIKVDALEEGPSIMLKNKTAREERGLRDGYGRDNYDSEIQQNKSASAPGDVE
ncbi:MAG: 30S ribosomal protein S6 [Rhodospirillaceae bacterium]